MIPQKRYITWLMLEGEEVEAIAKHLDSLSLPLLSNSAYTEIAEAAALLPLSPGLRRRLIQKRPWDEASRAMLDRLEFADIYDYRFKRPDISHYLEAQWKECKALLDQPTIRVTVETTLIAKVPTEELAPILMQQSGFHVTQEGLDLYCRYFFDCSAMRRDDWREYIKNCSNDPYVYVRYQTALLKPKDEVLYQVGLPTKTQFSQFLSMLVTTASYKFQHYTAHNKPESDAQARQWAKLGMDAGVRAEKFASGDVTDFAKAVQAEFDLVESDIPTIRPEMLANVRPALVEEAEVSPAPALPPNEQPEFENY